MIDIYASRRTNYDLARYWNPKEEPYNELFPKDKPDGVFYASKTGTQYDRSVNATQSFAVDDSILTIYTEDIVSIKPNATIEFQDELWRVEDVQKRETRKRAQFSKEKTYITYISMRR